MTKKIVLDKLSKIDWHALGVSFDVRECMENMISPEQELRNQAFHMMYDCIIAEVSSLFILPFLNNLALSANVKEKNELFEMINSILSDDPPLEVYVKVDIMTDDFLYYVPCPNKLTVDMYITCRSYAAGFLRKYMDELMYYRNDDKSSLIYMIAGFEEYDAMIIPYFKCLLSTEQSEFNMALIKEQFEYLCENVQFLSLSQNARHKKLMEIWEKKNEL